MLQLAFARLPIAAATPCPLDSLVEIPACWEMNAAAFEKEFQKDKNPFYVWLTKDKSRAKLSRNLYRNAEIDLSLFDGTVKVQEVIVDFHEDRLNLISFSIYNRGDAPDIGPDEFADRFKNTGREVGKRLEARPQRKSTASSTGLITGGFTWYNRPRGIALLEHNEKAMDGGDREFLRLQIARPDAKGALAASLRHSRGGAAIGLRELPGNLVRNEEGDVYIGNIPMVDQGAKGYCVVAATQRAFEYYGIGADMHQIAQVSGADPKLGTNPLLLAQALDKVDYRFKTRLSIVGVRTSVGFNDVDKKRGEYYVGKLVDERKFLKRIKDSVDDGIPLLWSLMLGIVPEKPQITVQQGGGHMRMIIGYNEKSNELIFTDSWGAGHEFKKVGMSDAYKVSLGLFILRPTVN